MSYLVTEFECCITDLTKSSSRRHFDEEEDSVYLTVPQRVEPLILSGTVVLYCIVFTEDDV